MVETQKNKSNTIIQERRNAPERSYFCCCRCCSPLMYGNPVLGSGELVVVIFVYSIEETLSICVIPNLIYSFVLKADSSGPIKILLTIFINSTNT